MNSDQYIPEPKDLLNRIKGDKNVKMISTQVPWAKSITLIDYSLNCSGQEEDTEYLKNACKWR
jgi:hypothetical protein